MRRAVILIVLLVLCVLLAIWAPWANLNFNLGSLLGFKQQSQTSGLQVYSLSGKLNIYLDNQKIGESSEGPNPFIKEDVTPGDHLLTLERESEVKNSYWTFGKVVTFLKGTSVVASYNLGPTEDFSEGHIIYFSDNINSQSNSNLYLNLNVNESTLTIDSNPIEKIEDNTINSILSLESQHTITIHKSGYDDLQFTILPSNQNERDALKNLNINIDAHLMLQPFEIENK